MTACFQQGLLRCREKDTIVATVINEDYSGTSLKKASNLHNKYKNSVLGSTGVTNTFLISEREKPLFLLQQKVAKNMWSLSV